MPYKILIIDDSELVRKGVTEMLTAISEATICGEAHDAEQGIRMVAELEPDLILLDVSMPGMNGLDAARQIRAHSAAVKILMMSQHDAAHLLPGAIAAGANGCIDKTEIGTKLIAEVKLMMRDPEARTAQ
jgi:two-component system response regulator NreC